MAIVENKSKIALVILAAGESKRMGFPKQLLPWKESTLLGHALHEAKKAAISEAFVVLGAHQKEISKKLDLSDVRIISNPNWKTGMAGSITATLTFFKQKKLKFDALLICLCDQPLLDSIHFNRLINRFKDSHYICATSYSDGYGVPAIFGNSFFSDLQQLEGKGGAKKLLFQNEHAIISVDDEGKSLDLDTRDTYDLYYEKYGK